MIWSLQFVLFCLHPEKINFIPAYSINEKKNVKILGWDITQFVETLGDISFNL